MRLKRKISVLGKYTNYPFNIIFGMNLIFMILISLLILTLKIYNLKAFLIILIIHLIFIFSFWMSELLNNYNFSMTMYKNYILGFLLFLVSELLMFFSVFWSWFHMSLMPISNYGGIWPLINFPSMNCWGLAFYNTLILFISSCFINYWETSIKTKIKKHFNINFLLWVILLGLYFLMIQFIEYSSLPMTFTDSMNSVLFFSITGLHLIHVIMGLIFLILSYISEKYTLNSAIYTNFNMQFKITCFYWHFVDIMWILVFLIVYVI